METKDEPPKSALKRRNSVGKGLSTVSFEVETLSQKNHTHDRIILKHSEQITGLSKNVKSIEKDIISLRGTIDNLTKQLSDILEG